MLPRPFYSKVSKKWSYVLGPDLRRHVCAVKYLATPPPPVRHSKIPKNLKKLGHRQTPYKRSAEVHRIKIARLRGHNPLDQAKDQPTLPFQFRMWPLMW